MSSSSPPGWYRPRGYLHFDAPLGLNKAEVYVCDPKRVASHAFFPLIKYTISTQKIRFNKASNAIEKSHKNRLIAYASHLDSHIFSYYATALARQYELKIAAAGLGSSVLAFRPLGLSNVDFAAHAFNDIASRSSCSAIALDITGFFDNLDHKYLQDMWAKAIDQKRLPDDHYAVFRAITRFSTVDRDALYSSLGISEHNPKNGRIRTCSIGDFRSKIRGAGLVERNSNSFGIPQGTPISALLSNIYMFEFDQYMKALVLQYAGSYFRYCDDILVIVPTTEVKHIAGDVRKKIKELHLDINPSKTEIRNFAKTGAILVADKPLQYLGFTFDGQRRLIRSAALARYSQKMKQGVRLAKLTAKSKNVARISRGLAPTPLYKRKLYEQYSHLGKKNFVRYGFRAAEILRSPDIRRQLEPLWDRLTQEIK